MEHNQYIETFADALQVTYDKHLPKKGETWKQMSEDELIKLLIQEVGEALLPDTKTSEFVDIALICNFIFAKRVTVGIDEVVVKCPLCKGNFTRDENHTCTCHNIKT